MIWALISFPPQAYCAKFPITVPRKNRKKFLSESYWCRSGARASRGLTVNWEWWWAEQSTEPEYLSIAGEQLTAGAGAFSWSFSALPTFPLCSLVTRSFPLSAELCHNIGWRYPGGEDWVTQLSSGNVLLSSLLLIRHNDNPCILSSLTDDHFWSGISQAELQDAWQQPTKLR